ncbi:MAG: hypothetical protein K9W43_12290 [Candidatus Thorarchaeota archaeon]|nr:hypothetical protein [Candidatus Thorarchaeota archaeon]
MAEMIILFVVWRYLYWSLFFIGTDIASLIGWTIDHDYLLASSVTLWYY